MKKILLSGFLSFILANNLYAMKEENIISDIKSNINNITTLIKSNENDEQKKEKIFNNLKNVIDFEIFYKLSLGKNFKKFSEEEYNKFKSSFEENLKIFYFSKFKNYNNQTFVFNEELKKTENNRLLLESSIVDEKGNKFSVNYKVYFNKDKQEWFVYDVLVEEISILKTYISQFNEILSSGTQKDLIVKLDNKNLEKQ